MTKAYFGGKSLKMACLSLFTQPKKKPLRFLIRWLSDLKTQNHKNKLSNQSKYEKILQHPINAGNN